MHAVQLENVTKRFGPFTAVDDLSLNVPKGSIYGFIGPNGSGKTTTMRMIMRILHPDAGHIRVLGEERHGAANDRVGYLPEERGLYKQMKVKDVLKFFAQLKNFRNCTQAIADWLERFGLSDWANKRVEALSKGMSQKVQFIAAVIAQPELVLLDEPFSGLDPVNAVVLREAVLELRKAGITIIFSTHDMSIAEKMCDTIFMIYKGKKVLDGTMDQIQEQYGTDTVRVRLAEGNVSLEGLPGVEQITDHGRMQELRLRRGHGDTQELLSALMSRGHVQHFELTRPSLHDIFVRIAGVDEAEVAAA
jgi:ABC-2 type transport system ATP-binding protein